MYEWHIAAVGHLSRNRFWGESEDVAARDVLATSTLVEGHGRVILIDPSFSAQEAQKRLLDARGIAPEAVTDIFITHYHFDHHTCLEAFPNARVYMADGDFAYVTEKWDAYHADWKQDTIQNMQRLRPAREFSAPETEVMPLPGHTMGTNGLVFSAPEGRVLAAGDAVMTKEFFRARSGYMNSWNDAEAQKSVARAGEAADVIIPGHGEAFLVSAYR